MNASMVDLRRRTREILKAIERNETVTIFYRGRPKAVLSPIGSSEKKRPPITEHPAFGMWKDREDMKDVHAYLRRMRARRRHVI